MHLVRISCICINRNMASGHTCESLGRLFEISTSILLSGSGFELEFQFSHMFCILTLQRGEEFMTNKNLSGNELDENLPCSSWNSIVSYIHKPDYFGLSGVWGLMCTLAEDQFQPGFIWPTECKFNLLSGFSTAVGMRRSSCSSDINTVLDTPPNINSVNVRRSFPVEFRQNSSSILPLEFLLPQS